MDKRCFCNDLHNCCHSISVKDMILWNLCKYEVDVLGDMFRGNHQHSACLEIPLTKMNGEVENPWCGRTGPGAVKGGGDQAQAVSKSLCVCRAGILSPWPTQLVTHWHVAGAWLTTKQSSLPPLCLPVGDPMPAATAAELGKQDEGSRCLHHTHTHMHTHAYPSDTFRKPLMRERQAGRQVNTHTQPWDRGEGQGNAHNRVNLEELCA